MISQQLSTNKASNTVWVILFICVAIWERALSSLFMIPLLFSKKQEENPYSSQITLVETTNSQLATISNQIEAQQQQIEVQQQQAQTLENLIKTQSALIKTQSTRQNLAINKIQLLHRENTQLQLQNTKLQLEINRLSESQKTEPLPKKKDALILIDSANLDHSARKLNCVVDYDKLKKVLQVLSKNANTVDAEIYIGAYSNNWQQQRFFSRLRHLGYNVITKPVVYQNGKPKANVDVDLAVNMVKKAFNYHQVFLVSGDGDYLTAIQEVQQQGVKITVVALKANTSHLSIKQADKYIDLASLKSQITLEQKLLNVA